MRFLLKTLIFSSCVTLNSLLKCFSIYTEEMDRSLFTLMSDDDDKRHTCFLRTFILQQLRVGLIIQSLLLVVLLWMIEICKHNYS